MFAMNDATICRMALPRSAFSFCDSTFTIPFWLVFTICGALLAAAALPIKETFCCFLFFFCFVARICFYIIVCSFVLRSFTQRRTLIEEATCRENEKKKEKSENRKRWILGEMQAFFLFASFAWDESFAVTFSLLILHIDGVSQVGESG